MFDYHSRTKPILKWAGGKSSLLPQLIVKFPSKFDRYIEPFLGSGACFFALTKPMPAILNDSNEELINLYRVVRDYPKKLIFALENLKKGYSESFYYEVRNSKPVTKVERAARTIFLNKTGFNGLYRQNSKGGFNVPFGKRPRCPALYHPEHLLVASDKLKFAELLNEDFEDVLKEAKKNDLIYCDPPYEPLSKTSSFNRYVGKGFCRKEQTRLRDAAHKASSRGAHVFISNSSAEFISDLYGDFDQFKIKARRAINSNGSRRGIINELLISV